MRKILSVGGATMLLIPVDMYTGGEVVMIRINLEDIVI